MPESYPWRSTGTRHSRIATARLSRSGPSGAPRLPRQLVVPSGGVRCGCSARTTRVGADARTIPRFSETHRSIAVERYVNPQTHTFRRSSNNPIGRSVRPVEPPPARSVAMATERRFRRTGRCPSWRRCWADVAGRTWLSCAARARLKEAPRRRPARRGLRLDAWWGASSRVRLGFDWRPRSVRQPFRQESSSRIERRPHAQTRSASSSCRLGRHLRVRR